MSKRPGQTDQDTKDEYDFSGGARGKFHGAGAMLVPPVHLEPWVLDYLQSRAARTGRR